VPCLRQNKLKQQIKDIFNSILAAVLRGLAFLLFKNIVKNPAFLKSALTRSFL